MADETIRSWNDLDETARAAALDDYHFSMLKATYPGADFSERDRLLAKYAIKLTCLFCNATTDANYLTGIPEICPQCKRKSLDIPTAPGKVANWLLQHYRFATTEDKDQNIYAYDDATGTWNDEKADAILKRELEIIYNDELTSQKYNNVKLAIQAKTFFPRDRFATVLRRDGDKMYLNLANGVLDMGALKLLPHAAPYYFLGRIDVQYDPDAAVPEKFIGFLADITYPSEANFISLLEAFGYPLLSGYPIQRAVALIGAGANGKSTFLKAMERFYGDRYISHLSLQQLANAIEQQPFALLQLIGKVANIADDLPTKAVKDVGYFKQLTGGSSVEAERKFGSRISFTNSAKFFFAANQMPAVSEDTIAFYRRFHFIEFSNMIENPRDQKEMLEDIMGNAEKSGLLNLLLMHVVPRLQKQNDFTCAKEVDEIAEQYQRHSNTAQLFCTTCIDYNSDAVVRKEELWASYQQYCAVNDLMEDSQKLFWRTIAEEFPQAQERQSQEGGVRKRVILGLRLHEPVTFKKMGENRMITVKEYFEVPKSAQDTQDTRLFPYFNKNIEGVCNVYYNKEKTVNVVHPVQLDTTPHTLSLSIEPSSVEPSPVADIPTKPTTQPQPQSLTPAADPPPTQPQNNAKTTPNQQSSLTQQQTTQQPQQDAQQPQIPAKDEGLSKEQMIDKTLAAIRLATELGIRLDPENPDSRLNNALEGMTTYEIGWALEELQRGGDIYQPRPGIWRVVGVEE